MSIGKNNSSFQDLQYSVSLYVKSARPCSHTYLFVNSVGPLPLVVHAPDIMPIFIL